MAELFLMPQSSPTMESGRLIAWTKSEGDKLAPQDVIAEGVDLQRRDLKRCLGDSHRRAGFLRRSC